MIETDVAVIGGGISGVAAAVTAARSGCRTVLVENSALPGGIAVKGNISTLCGLYFGRPDGRPEMLYDGFPEEFASQLMKRDNVDGPIKMGRMFVLPCRSRTLKDTICSFLEIEAGLTALYSTQFLGVRLNADRIIRIDVAAKKRKCEIKAEAVIDCSGDAVVCRSAGGAVILPDHSRQAPAVIFPLENIDMVCEFKFLSARVKMLFKEAAEQKRLPLGAEGAILLPMLEKNSVSVKLNLGRFTQEPSGRTPGALEKTANALKDHLVRFFRKQVAGFESCTVPPGEYPVLYRDGIKAKGLYVLSAQDVLEGRKTVSAVTRGCWPIEKWDAEGNLDIRYLPEGDYYDIPEASLRVAGFENLMTAGKCISADNNAIASARVIGTCLATGEAAAKLAVTSLA